MPENPNPDYEAEGSEYRAISASVKAYIDQQIKNVIEHQGAADKKKKWRNSWRSASPITQGTFVLTAIVAIATAAYSIIAAFQVSEMRKTNTLTRSALDKADQNSAASSEQFQVQLRHFDAGLGKTGLLALHAGEQAAAANKLAVVAGKQADSSEVQSDLSREALNSVQRPYLIFTSARIDVGELEDYALVEGNWQNVGNTPSPTFYFRSHFEPSKEMSLPSFAFSNKDPISHSTLGTHEPFHLWVATPKSSLTIRGSQGFFYGWAVYTDFFKGSEPHLTEFAFRLMFDIRPANGPYTLTTNSYALPEHSCYDRECKDYSERVKEALK